MSTRVKGGLISLLGLLMIAAALCLIGRNKLESVWAGEHSAAALQALRQTQPILSETRGAAARPVPPTPVWAEEEAAMEGEEEIPDHILNPKMDMPVVKHDGNSYIAVLDIPALELELPVINEWSYDRLEIAPCRYYGSAYTGDLVIAGHAYETHFYPLQSLSLGDEVYLTDMDGNVFIYDVAEVVTMRPTAIAEMIYSDYDMTLFTCTPGGSNRLAVRCALKETRLPA